MTREEAIAKARELMDQLDLIVSDLDALADVITDDDFDEARARVTGGLTELEAWCEK